MWIDVRVPLVVTIMYICNQLSIKMISSQVHGCTLLWPKLYNFQFDWLLPSLKNMSLWIFFLLKELHVIPFNMEGLNSLIRTYFKGLLHAWRYQEPSLTWVYAGIDWLIFCCFKYFSEIFKCHEQRSWVHVYTCTWYSVVTGILYELFVHYLYSLTVWLVIYVFVLKHHLLICTWK